MTVTVKNKTKIPLVVPPAVRRRAGHRNGEDLEFRLAKADADIRAGRVSKAFSDHAGFIADLHKEAAKVSARKTKRPAK